MANVRDEPDVPFLALTTNGSASPRNITPGPATPSWNPTSGPSTSNALSTTPNPSNSRSNTPPCTVTNTVCPNGKSAFGTQRTTLGSSSSTATVPVTTVGVAVVCHVGLTRTVTPLASTVAGSTSWLNSIRNGSR